VKTRRRERALVLRHRMLLVVWLLAVTAIVARAGQLQVLQAEHWSQVAQEQQWTTRELPAPRGTIVDRNGVPLALTRDRLRVAVAPRELADRDEAIGLLSTTLELSAQTAHQLTDPTRRWSVVLGSYRPSVRAALAGVRGIHLTPELERFYPHGEVARGVLGAVIDGASASGIEQRYEEVLHGRPGREVAARDIQGREVPGEVVRLEEPVPGGMVRLTLDLHLQEITHQALTEALELTGASGADALVTDPATGEVLALVSIKEGRADALSAINTPYEPGSTLKPFTVAGLLARHRLTLEDSVETSGGSWTVADRTITDVHASIGDMTLAEALRESSNVGVARAAQALSVGEQYATLRDFGFGTPTGIDLPGEASGTLRRPGEWSRQSPVSLAIGYEIGVTPLQMALAYGAIANGGFLMEPRLIVEARDDDGRLVERPEPRVLRRVISDSVARSLADVLEDVVEEGTGTAVSLETFPVAGKTGTARAYMNGEYEAGNYFSSFVGFFPADAPQLVLFVKLDSPKGAYFGGVTAAPVARGIIEGILAARQNLLDGPALLRSVRPSAPGPAPERPEAQRARFIPLSTAREPPAAAPITGAAPSDSTLPTRSASGCTGKGAARR
jgi:cell division protein FtsI (penicillin-binding protein 3)